MNSDTLAWNSYILVIIIIIIIIIIITGFVSMFSRSQSEESQVSHVIVEKHCKVQC